MRALAVTSATPMSLYPDARPVSDLVPNFEAATWYGLYAPKGTAPEIVNAMYQAYLKSISDPAWQASLASRGIRLLAPADYAPAQFGAHTAAEIDRWQEVIRQAGIQPQ